MLNVKRFQIQKFIPNDYEADLTPRLRTAQDQLQNATGAGSDFVGWVHLPRDYDRAEFARIQAAAAKIQSSSKALVVIGIGGSYLGARGVIECLCSPNYNLKKKNTPNVYFVGNGLSSDSLQEVMELLGDDDFSVNVISKSGTTTEPAVAFRFFREKLVEKYGREGAKERIFATTDKARGALKSLADAEGWETFVVPDEVGGRYSVLTAVGLLPIAVTGVDIDQLMAGAAKMMEVCGTLSMLLTLDPPEFTLSYGGDIWGVVSILLFPPLYGTLLKRKITRRGVWACIAAGTLSILLFYPPYKMGTLAAHPAMFGVILSGLAMEIVSYLDRRKGGTA